MVMVGLELILLSLKVAESCMVDSAVINKGRKDVER